MFRIAKLTAPPIVPVALMFGVLAITACSDQFAQEGESPAADGQVR